MCSCGRGPCQGAAAGDCIHALGAVGTPAVARQLRPPFWRGLWAHHLLAGHAVVDDRGVAAGSHGQELRRPLFKGALRGRTVGFNGVLTALWWRAGELPAGRPRGRLRPRRVLGFTVMPHRCTVDMIGPRHGSELLARGLNYPFSLQPALYNRI